MSLSGLVDLDALAAKCYSRSGKAFLQEAIQCYRVGSLRAAISSTWQAIVFDYIEKLEELSLDGDAFAIKNLGEFKHYSQNKDIKKLLDFEREILRHLRDDLQFLSVTEETDLSRIKDDRNRCSHPTFNFDEEPFSPSPEQVRAHIVNAFNILLSQPPTYGKSALNGILEYFQSPNFPSEDEIAITRLSKTRLGSARKSLVFNLVKVLLKSAFQHNSSTAEFYFHKLSLVLRIHRELVLECLQHECEKIYSKAEIDGHFYWILGLIGSDPEIFALLSIHYQKEAEAGLKKIIADRSLFELKVGNLSKIPNLLTVFETNLKNLGSDDLEAIFKSTGKRLFFEEIVNKYCKSRSYTDAGAFGRIIVLNNKHLVQNQIDDIFEAFKNNRQISGYINNSQVIECVISNKLINETTFRDLISKNNLSDFFPEERISLMLSRAD